MHQSCAFVEKKITVQLNSSLVSYPDDGSYCITKIISLVKVFGPFQIAFTITP